jgi:hypothetical protein
LSAPLTVNPTISQVLAAFSIGDANLRYSAKYHFLAA